MADNVIANPGAGGTTFRALQDGSGIDWPADVPSYATTVSAGANVLQVVTPLTGLPVQPQTDTTANGTIPSAGGGTGSVTITLNGQSSIGVDVSGTWTGLIVFEGSVDGTHWLASTIIPLNLGSPVGAVTANTTAQANTAGLVGFRARGNTVGSGTATINFRGCVSGPPSVMLDNITSTGTALDVNLKTSSIGVAPIAATSGGATPFHYISAASANQDSQNVKASAGQVYSVNACNLNAAARYLKLYDKATAPTSADTPVHTLMMPGASAGAGFVLSVPVGLVFASGIGFRLTTGIADNDANAVAAAEIAVNLGYK